MSSSTSSPNIIHIVILTTHSVRAKSDPTWNHCKLCYNGGGIHRIKQHLVREKRDVSLCFSVPFEVRHQLKEQLNQVSGSRKIESNQIRR
ncbi:hypothetical protein Lal_00031951 [Lupinus albus]|nr:hypothetical protein Lal_00031951 [Lupinus albus]